MHHIPATQIPMQYTTPVYVMPMARAFNNWKQRATRSIVVEITHTADIH